MMQINKTDRNDAAGIARIMQIGWFKEVRVKDHDSHSIRALLTSGALLVKIKRDLENQICGPLKNLGLVIGRAKFNVFVKRAETLIADHPELVAAVKPLLNARKAVEQQVGDLDRKVRTPARHDAQVKSFMTVPDVGPITALCFQSTIDDPTRFKRSRSVGAYVGLTTQRHASTSSCAIMRRDAPTAERTVGPARMQGLAMGRFGAAHQTPEPPLRVKVGARRRRRSVKMHQQYRRMETYRRIERCRRTIVITPKITARSPNGCRS
jgi:transposase